MIASETLCPGRGRGSLVGRDDQGGGEESSSVAEQAGGLAQRDVLPVGVVVAGVEGPTDVAVG
jgi:hypothetical protein